MILCRARDLCVEQPYSWHICAESRGSGGVERHDEFEEKDLGGTAETVVGY